MSVKIPLGLSALFLVSAIVFASSPAPAQLPATAPATPRAAPAGAPAPATAPASAPAGHYKSFSVCVYCPQGTLVQGQNVNLQALEQRFNAITAQIKIDKVYIETFRSMRYTPEAAIEPLKKFFTDRGIKVAGGMTLAYNDSGQFQTFSMADPQQRATIKAVSEMTAKHFDEVILDDFFFYSTKTDADIAAKGDKSWTDYRLDAMREASANLVVKPAKAVNPKIKMVIKFPNWYEHFQGLGYDLDQEPKIFDGIYTGTETRDPLATEQHLQPYESYQIFRYLENIKPGGNGGGWVDTFQYTVIDRYAEQLWDTVFAKPPEMMLFNWNNLNDPIRPGPRNGWQDLHTSFDLAAMTNAYQTANATANPQGPAQPTMARAAGYALEQVDQFLYKTGKPIGLKSYRPYQAEGEDFLHNFLGMAGIPIDLYPTFPADANTMLLTQAAASDPDIVKKIKGQLTAGKNVVITSGLVKALQERATLGKDKAPDTLKDICDLEYTGNKIQVTDFHQQGGNPIPNSHMNAPIIFPELKFKTNDAWFVIGGVADNNGFPILISDKYSKGVLYILAIPDNFADLYNLPPSVLNMIRGILLRDLPARVDGPAQVGLFEYDNNTFILQNFAPIEANVTLALSRGNTLKDLVTNQPINPAGGAAGRGGPRGGGAGRGNNPDFIPPRTNYGITLKPHSYQAFIAE